MVILFLDLGSHDESLIMAGNGHTRPLQASVIFFQKGFIFMTGQIHPYLLQSQYYL